MTVEFAGLTDVGRQRDHNEDTYVADEELGFYVLCDGMGGHAAGEVASDIAANTVAEVIREKRAVLEAFASEDNLNTRAEVAFLIEEAVVTACARVWKVAQADPSKAGMGTTLEMVVVVGHVGFMGHVGDSRLYMKRNGEVHQLSEDHSFVREMVRMGRLTEEEARHSPVANVITRAVGIQETVQVDTLVFDILPGDELLLCSDGLSDYLEGEAELAGLLTDAPLSNLTQSLVSLANERGGKDNVTVLLLRGLPDETEEQQARVQDLGVKLDTLKNVRLFRHLNYKELVLLLNLKRVEEHPAGTVLMQEGRREEDLYVVLNGRVEVSRQGHKLAELTAGDHFGEMELITTRPRGATVKTMVDSSFLVVGRSELFALLKANESLAVKLLWGFLQSLSVRLYETNAQVAEAKDELGEEVSLPF